MSYSKAYEKELYALIMQAEECCGMLSMLDGILGAIPYEYKEAWNDPKFKQLSEAVGKATFRMMHMLNFIDEAREKD